MNEKPTGGREGTLVVLTLTFGLLGAIFGLSANFMGFGFSITAVVLGAIEITRINQGKSSPGGRGFTITGMVLGAVGVISGVIFSAVLPQFPNGIWNFLRPAT